jgi:hypothetical protein
MIFSTTAAFSAGGASAVGLIAGPSRAKGRGSPSASLRRHPRLMRAAY